MDQIALLHPAAQVAVIIGGAAVAITWIWCMLR